MNSKADWRREKLRRIHKVRTLTNSDLADYLNYEVQRSIHLAAMAIALGRILEWIDQQETPESEA